jgi:hypothetical protein
MVEVQRDGYGEQRREEVGDTINRPSETFDLENQECLCKFNNL